MDKVDDRRRLAWEKVLKDHISDVHEKRKDHVCGICGKAYTTKTRLKYHVTFVHENKLYFKCKLCPKYFSSNEVRKRHLETTHEGKSLDNLGTTHNGEGLEFDLGSTHQPSPGAPKEEEGILEAEGSL